MDMIFWYKQNAMQMQRRAQLSYRCILHAKSGIADGSLNW